MGVLTEIGAMRCVVLVLLSVSAWRGGAAAGCPSLCSCRGGRPEAAGEPPPDEPLRLRCGPSPAQITELKEIDFANISASVVSLNMSGNAISTLSRELHLPNLQKLDLSHNRIGLIESDAFYNVTALQRLDVSHNRIAALARDVFRGLARLERLLLAHNLLAALAPGTFDHLVALKLLDITENRLVCDCALVWLGAWARGGARLAGAPRCHAPAALAGRPLRRLRALLPPAACAPPQPALRLRPAADQLVFEGDALALACAAPAASALHPYRLRWAHPALEACDVNVTDTDVLEAGVAETTARLPNVTRHHAGAWTCLYEDERLGRHNATVAVLVLAADTRYCATSVSADNKGLYSWPQLPLNRTAEVPCRAGAALASRRCGADGAWERADTSRCAYVANVTKLLQQFALLDVGLVRYSALNATARLAALLRAGTAPPAEIRDPDDVMFVARAVRSYMRHAPEELDLGSALLDVISAAMDVAPGVMALAEAQYGACTQLVRAAAELARIPSDKQKANLAVESFPVRPGFGGATCVWYSAGAADAPRLHCTTTNRTVARLLTFADALVHASVQVPASLVFALAPGAAGARLVLAVFRDAALFPLLPADAPPDAHRAKDYYGRSTKREDMNMEITSPVLSVQLENGSLAGALPEPVVGTLRAAGCGPGARAAVWDPATQRWQHNSSECRVLHVAGCTAVVALARPGVCALLARAERGIFGARTHGARFKLSHPAVYVGSLVLGACLAAAALTYAAAFPALLMPRRAKHAHLNTWLALAALCLLYTLGVYQTEDARLCRALGLAIHYLSLSALLWQCAAAHVLHRAAARARRPPAAGADPPPRRPVLGLYLAGWGVALIVVGISGAVNLREYAGYAQCFLSSAAALGALFVPGALLLLLLAALLLLTRCALPEPEPEPLRRGPGSARSLDSDAEDAERAPSVQLRAQAIVLALFLATWASAAAAVYRPLPAYLPYQEDICSILYAVCATVLGTFILFFYGIARSDVRAQWALMHCYLRKSKRCCRNRSVFDSGRPPAPASASAPAPAARSRSASRGSGRPGSGAGTADTGLVALHRRQYRADGSAAARAGGATPPEAFYNPDQMNVAKKFFKRQRQNVKRNRLELPARRDFDDDSPACGGGGAGPELAAAERASPGPNPLEEGGERASPSTNRESRDESEEPKANPPIVNIYTNVGETAAPQHHVLAAPATRAASAQCSLDYSSSEPAPRSGSAHTPDTFSEPTSPLEPATPADAAATTDTDSFGRYVACPRPPAAPAPAAVASAAAAAAAAPAPDARSTDASEQGFENESDIYCPNYQASEVSIRSHGLYAPSPVSMCPPELGSSAEDVSRAESQYANLEPGWRAAAPRRASAASGASELDALYTRVSGRAEPAPADGATDLDELYTRISARAQPALADGAFDLDELYTRISAGAEPAPAPVGDAIDLDELYTRVSAGAEPAPVGGAIDLDELYTRVSAGAEPAPVGGAIDLDELYTRVSAGAEPAPVGGAEPRAETAV